jgi:hypothetical protein
MNETEFCHCTVNKEDLDDYLHRERIAIRVCTYCTPRYEFNSANIYTPCPKHEAQSERDHAADMIRSQQELDNAAAYLEGKHRPRKKPRSDGKTEIKQKYERCMNRSERRQKKIDRRK